MLVFFSSFLSVKINRCMVLIVAEGWQTKYTHAYTVRVTNAPAIQNPNSKMAALLSLTLCIYQNIHYDKQIHTDTYIRSTRFLLSSCFIFWFVLFCLVFFFRFYTDTAHQYSMIQFLWTKNFCYCRLATIDDEIFSDLFLSYTFFFVSLIFINFVFLDIWAYSIFMFAYSLVWYDMNEWCTFCCCFQLVFTVYG